MHGVRKAANRTRRLLRYVWNHPANSGARFQAVTRALRFQVRGRLRNGPALARVGEKAVMEAPLHATGASKVIYANPPDWAEMHAWRRLLHQGDLFIDVGSNAGLYSIWAADCGATPVAVEPDPVNAQRTRHNLRLNSLPVEVFECALGAETGQMDFTLDGDTLNHLVPSGALRAVRSVQVRRLDDVLGQRHARGMKIDVEGAERLVIEGAQQTLREQRVDVIQLEWNALSQGLLGESRTPVTELLTSHGYVLCEPDPADNFALRRVSPGSAREADVFAVSPRARQELGIT